MEKSIESDMTDQESEKHRDETLDDVTDAAFKEGWEPVYYHGPHELCITAGEPQNQLILS